MRPRQLAYAAAAMAVLSALPSVFWTLGSTLLLDTVGGSIEELARARSVAALVLGAAAALAKFGAAVLALALVQPWGRRGPDRLLLAANAVVSVVLITWGGANVLMGSLSLAGVVTADGLDERALRWHVFVWDLWFLVWGVVLALALAAVRRANRRRRSPLKFSWLSARGVHGRPPETCAHAGAPDTQMHPSRSHPGSATLAPSTQDKPER